MEEPKQLTKYEIAAVTAGVPSTEDQALNAIILTALRFKTAAEIVAAHRTRGFLGKQEDILKSALSDADALIAAFTGYSANGQKTQA